MAWTIDRWFFNRVKDGQNSGRQKKSAFTAVTGKWHAPIYHSKHHSTMTFLVKHLTFLVTLNYTVFWERNIARQLVVAVPD